MKILEFVFFVSIVVPGATVSVNCEPLYPLASEGRVPGSEAQGCNSLQGKKQFKAGAGIGENVIREDLLEL